MEDRPPRAFFGPEQQQQPVDVALAESALRSAALRTSNASQSRPAVPKLMQQRLMQQMEQEEQQRLWMDEEDTFAWTARYQAVMARPRSTPHERMVCAVEERKLFKEFSEHAAQIAQQLVHEISLPIEEKTIKPLNTRGVAGGESLPAPTKNIALHPQKNITPHTAHLTPHTPHAVWCSSLDRVCC